MNGTKSEPETAAPVSSTHVIRELPILVLMPHSRCNCRCLMCDIWRIRQIREITADDLAPHISSLRELKVQWVVFSGGEPLMHSDLLILSRMLRGEGIRTTLLTAGLILERHGAQVAENIDDIIVSLDGPQEVHDRIRGVPDAYRRLKRGIDAVRVQRPGMPIHGRCTVQKNNFRQLSAVVHAARELNLDSLSFLAADMSPQAFNHATPWPKSAMMNVVLSPKEVDELTNEVENLISNCQADIRSGFIRESPEKLRRIAFHFQAHLGQVAPRAFRCNAPWVSAVIESNGDVRPCFFHPPFGNVRDGPLIQVLNGLPAVRFRSQLNIFDDPICQRCVCSLFLDQGSAGVMGSGGEEADLASPSHLQNPHLDNRMEI
jgi:MoaA/NifB/PqqE/SkfB family radical SAM enzyme